MVNPRPLLFALLATACGIDLPEEALLDGPRVLAVRVVPADSDEPRPAAAITPGTPATAEVLVVDDAGPIDATSTSALWVACPLGVGLPAFSCLEETLPVERDAIPMCPSSTDTTQPLPAPCILADTLDPDFTVPVFEQALSGARLELTLILALEPREDVSDCADSLFRGDYDTPDGCTYTSYALTFARPDQDPNRHPGPGTILATVGDDAPVEVASGEALSVADGESVTLTYQPAREDTEAYEIPINNGASTETIVEDPYVRWFRTGGEFVTEAPFALGDEVGLDLPNETTRVYAVLRDGRGGVGWWWADFVPD